MNESNRSFSSWTILTPLFTALIAAGAFIKIPIGAVPITLQTLFCFLLALLLPVKNATISVALYLLLGAIGLPIFTTGGGIAALTGPTGGFLFALLPASIVGSLIAQKKRDSILFNVLVILVMEVIIYFGGVSYLKYSRDLTFKSAMLAGCVPFIPGDILKIIVASISAKYLYPECEKLRVRREKQETEE